MVLLAILTGIVIVLVIRRHVGWTMSALLISWGLLASTTALGRFPAGLLGSLSGLLQQWF